MILEGLLSGIAVLIWLFLEENMRIPIRKVMCMPVGIWDIFIFGEAQFFLILESQICDQKAKTD